MKTNAPKVIVHVEVPVATAYNAEEYCYAYINRAGGTYHNALCNWQIALRWENEKRDLSKP